MMGDCDKPDNMNERSTTKATLQSAHVPESADAKTKDASTQTMPKTMDSLSILAKADAKTKDASTQTMPKTMDPLSIMAKNFEVETDIVTLPAERPVNIDIVGHTTYPVVKVLPYPKALDMNTAGGSSDGITWSGSAHLIPYICKLCKASNYTNNLNTFRRCTGCDKWLCLKQILFERGDL